MSRDDDSTVPPALREALERDRSGADDAPAPPPDWDEVWALLGRASPPADALPDADETWKGVRRHLDAEDERGDSSEGARRADDRRPRRPSSRDTRRWAWRWGSAVAAVLLLGVAAWWWTQPVALTTAPGTTQRQTLPDGSAVELNADTRLTYPRSFETVAALEADRRVVTLRGEAYFEVEPGGRPFVVRTATARVEVTGTAFSVQSRDEDETQVALAEGRLRVTGRDPGATPVTLRPGQSVRVDAGGRPAAVRDTSLRRILAWRRGGFAVTSTPLPTLARTLERRFGQSVRLDSSIPETVRSAPLTLYYARAVRLETILHDVCRARSLTYRPTATGFVLARPDDAPTPRSP